VAGFVRVSSLFYPSLRRHYEHEADRWLDDRLLEDYRDGQSCPCGFDGLMAEDDPELTHEQGCRIAAALERAPQSLSG
jgi:hypothetical protein